MSTDCLCSFQLKEPVQAKKIFYINHFTEVEQGVEWGGKKKDGRKKKKKEMKSCAHSLGTVLEWQTTRGLSQPSPPRQTPILNSPTLQRGTKILQTRTSQCHDWHCPMVARNQKSPWLHDGERRNAFVSGSSSYTWGVFACISTAAKSSGFRPRLLMHAPRYERTP